LCKSMADVYWWKVRKEKVLNSPLPCRSIQAKKGNCRFDSYVELTRLSVLH